jgi:hypothetical protein
MSYQIYSRLIFRKNSLLVACCITLLAWLLSGLVVASLAAPPLKPDMKAKTMQTQLSQKFAQLIDDDNEWGAIEPHMTKDAFGNEMAIWEAFDGVRYRIWSKRRILNSPWGITSPVENNLGNAYAPRIAFDAHGNALAVWQQGDDTHSHIWSNRYVAGRGWSVATRLSTSNTGHAIGPQLVTDAKGNAMVVWHQIDGVHGSIASTHSILANRYDVKDGWGFPVFIDNKSAFAKSPLPAVDANGNVMVVWHNYDNKRTNIRANRYESGRGWGKSIDIESNKSGLAYNPHIVITDKGYAQVMWQQIVGANNHLWANRFTTGKGWGNAKRLETDGASVVDMAQIAKNIK